MSKYTSLIATINANIRKNGNQEITGQVLNAVLNAMVGSLGANYQFAGVATKTTDPGTPDQRVFYVPTESGTYPNFGGLSVPKNKVYFFTWDGAWKALDTHMCEEMQDAEDARVAAEVVRATQEAQRVLNENQRIANELVRQQGEATRNTKYEAAETSRNSSYTSAEATRNSTFTQAESVRNAGEVTRQQKEGERQSAEVARQSAESLRVSAEEARVSAESERSSAEETRVASENTRVSSEATRVSQESSRQSAESTRTSNENQRISSEATRQSNESTRQSQESSRQNAEASRVSTFNTNEATRTSTFNTNEARREAAYQTAIDNLGNEVVKTIPQSLTNAEQDTARKNIGVREDTLSYEDGNALGKMLTSAPADNVFVNRVSPAPCDGVAKVDKIKGNSVVWNQLATKQTISATAGTYPDEQISNNLVAGHKYIVLWYQATTLTSVTRNTPHIYNQYQSGQENNHLAAGWYSWIVTAESTFPMKYWLHTPNVDCTISNITITDLTLLADADILAASDADAIALFKARYGSMGTSYNAGEVKSFKAEKVEITSRNLWDEEWEVGKINNDNGNNVASSANIRTKNYIPIVGGNSYYISANGSHINNFVMWYDESKSFITFGYSASLNVFTAPANARYVRFFMNDSYGTTYKHDIILSAGSTALPYEPYRSTEWDCNPAEVTRPDWGRKVFDGTEGAWMQYDANEGRVFYYKDASFTSNESASFVCNSYTNKGSYSSLSGMVGDDIVWWRGGSFGVAFRDLTYDDIAAWKAHLAALYAAGTPLIVDYELASPSTYTGAHPALFANGLCSAGSAYDEMGERQSVKRLGKKVYSSDEVSAAAGSYSSIVYFEIAKPQDAASKGTIRKAHITSKYPYNSASDNWDTASKIGYFFDGASYSDYWIGFPVGTTLEQAKAAIDGLEVVYELASPIVVDYTERKMVRPTFANGSEALYATRESRNLWDMDNMVRESGYYDDNGVKKSMVNANYDANYIPVSPSATYNLCGNILNGTNINGAIYFYDASKAWISRQTGLSQNAEGNVITTPANCKYIRIQFGCADGSTPSPCMLNAGSTALPYESAEPQPDQSATSPARFSEGQPLDLRSLFSE